MPVNPFRATGEVAYRPVRLRRSCLAVPGSNLKYLKGAADSEADQVFLDLEDAVAPNEKKGARDNVVEALNDADWSDKVVAVRVNDVTTRWCYGDIIELVKGAGDNVDCLMIPKVQDPGQLWFVENLLTELEKDEGLATRIGLEVQIETGTGSITMAEIAAVTDRTEALIFGPGDYAADQGVWQRDLGMVEPNYPGHQWHYIMAQIVNNARPIGAQAIDGPYGDYGDEEGYRQSGQRAVLLGYDGKWCIHPSQVPLANEIFTPTKDEFEFAQGMLEAYQEAIDEGKGAASFKGKMIDEASRKMAEKFVNRGEAAGMTG